MVETIVAISVIAVFSISIYTFTSSTIKNYESKERYNVIDDLYKLNTVKNYIINNNYLRDITYSLNEENLMVLDETFIPAVILNELSINKIFVTIPTKEKELLNQTSIDEEFKDYLNWQDFETNEDSVGTLIAEFKRNDKYYFAYIDLVGEL